MQTVEIEIDGSHNEHLHFRPLQRSVRGRFDFNRIGEPMARIKATEWPLPIPSQRIGIEANGTGYIIEPLHDAEHAPIREKIEKTGKKLEPALQSFDNIHVPSWMYWIQRAVESGIARVVSGKLPAKIEGTPKKSFIFAEPEPSTTDKLTAAIDRQTAVFEKLISVLADK